ncbi:hypothetical protein L1D14_07270 [Vibrio tubiashii]|uniref:hypothetical protein n=1 Tax=Vibrio tubiashii TaxID=29498 RepID=UPI001EFD2C2E|nr:hypothetical protein [Vibrio tubiashii]MCG9576037.1 hypothetical protein [Vibrio tubiashii]
MNFLFNPEDSFTTNIPYQEAWLKELKLIVDFEAHPNNKEYDFDFTALYITHDERHFCLDPVTTGVCFNESGRQATIHFESNIDNLKETFDNIDPNFNIVQFFRQTPQIGYLVEDNEHTCVHEFNRIVAARFTHPYDPEINVPVFVVLESKLNDHIESVADHLMQGVEDGQPTFIACPTGHTKDQELTLAQLESAIAKCITLWSYESISGLNRYQMIQIIANKQLCEEEQETFTVTAYKTEEHYNNLSSELHGELSLSDANELYDSFQDREYWLITLTNESGKLLR